MANRILVLVTPDYISVKNTRRVLSLFNEKLGYPDEKIKLGLNQLFPEHFRKPAVKKLMERDNFDFELPPDPAKFLGLFKDGELEVLKNDQSDYSKAVAGIAVDVLHARPRGEEPGDERSGILGKLFKKQ
jgi:hypothetical protein